ncbi:PilN domain-containing protein [Cerasicoccus maritimus]|uniref:PilN domain-containing protein n=1 Tax=Cerasicoccus maritimus TaxID=490089 RepID=UPI002852B750|nr:PilN domain-containing protein [Cerasicoccus maritimus]
MLKLPDNLIRVAEARAPEVLLTPGGYFFCRLIPLPEELTRSEYASLAELTLEECAPFPLEQLAWGFMVDDARRELWIFAACRPRIGQSALDEWDDAEHVFPAFLPLLLTFPEPPRQLVWQSEQEVMLMEFAEGARFPQRIRHRRFTERSEDDETPIVTRTDEVRDYLVSQGVDPEATPIYQLHETRVSADRQVTFVVSQSAEGAEPEVPAVIESVEASWWADLRAPEFIASEQRSRRWQNNLWVALKWSGWAAVFLICMLLFNFVGNVLVERRQDKIIAQDPVVLAVEQNANFLADLRRFTESPLQPYEILGLTNLKRPIKNIWYRAAEVDNTDGVTIQGYANSVNEVNDFWRSLTNSGEFKMLETARYRRRGSEYEFTLRLDYVGQDVDVGESLAAMDAPLVEESIVEGSGQ